MTSALSLKSLNKRFRSVVAVDDVSIEVGVGEFVALLGPSGSGKTTMLRLLAGFDLPSAGQIVIEGRDVSGLPPAERNIGMVFQHYALFPHMSIRRNIEYGLRMHGWAPAARKARVDELRAMVRLEAVGSRMPHQLSGGQQQRVAMARALALKPALLVLDEPTASLDVSIQAQIIGLLERLQDEMGLTYLFISHDLALVKYFCDEVLVMYLGRVVEALRDTDAPPRHPYTRTLLDSTFEPDPKRRRVIAPLSGEVPSPFDLGPGCAFAARCPRATQICQDETPLLAASGGGHPVACHHPD